MTTDVFLAISFKITIAINHHTGWRILRDGFFECLTLMSLRFVILYSAHCRQRCTEQVRSLDLAFQNQWKPFNRPLRIQRLSGIINCYRNFKWKPFLRPRTALFKRKRWSCYRGTKSVLQSSVRERENMTIKIWPFDFATFCAVLEYFICQN